MERLDLPPWELLQKNLTWAQLDFIHHMKLLDFGSGNGITADHFAADNEVTAVEPDESMFRGRTPLNQLIQLTGSLSELRKFESETFDAILCHNVLEYAEEREEIIQEFSRILKKGGYLSVLKHNRAGRVMQMVVLLNNFEHANELLDGKNGNAARFGPIRYYDDSDIVRWSDGALKTETVLGIRTFWYLQQNQEIQKEEEWQKKMLAIEQRVSGLDEYKAVAFFHHLILRKM